MNVPENRTGDSSGPEGPDVIRMGRRVYRGIAFAILVGLAAAGLAAVPSLFVQSIFVVEAERCTEAQQRDIAATGQVQTDCGDFVASAPVWLPIAVVVGGAGVGVLGGFAYGFVSPSSIPRTPRGVERPWLPF